MVLALPLISSAGCVVVSVAHNTPTEWPSVFLLEKGWTTFAVNEKFFNLNSIEFPPAFRARIYVYARDKKSG